MNKKSVVVLGLSVAVVAAGIYIVPAVANDPNTSSSTSSMSSTSPSTASPSSSSSLSSGLGSSNSGSKVVTNQDTITGDDDY